MTIFQNCLKSLQNIQCDAEKIANRSTTTKLRSSFQFQALEQRAGRQPCTWHSYEWDRVHVEHSALKSENELILFYYDVRVATLLSRRQPIDFVAKPANKNTFFSRYALMVSSFIYLLWHIETISFFKWSVVHLLTILSKIAKLCFWSQMAQGGISIWEDQ